MAVQSFIKEPNEKYVVAVEYAGLSPTGETLVSGTVSALNLVTGTDATGTVLSSPTLTVAGTQAKATVRAGTSGTEYKLTFLTTWSGGSILEDELLMAVVDL